MHQARMEYGERLFMKKRANRGFTLVEMLVVIGLIGLLVSLMVGGLKVVQTLAVQTQAQELVSNVSTALSLYIAKEGTWPDEILQSGGVVNNAVCKVLQQAELLDVTTVKADGTINQNSKDRFGMLSPWGQREVRKRPLLTASLGALPSDSQLVKHLLQFRVDIDLDGKIDSSDTQLGALPAEATVIRASAIVWSCGPQGKAEGSTGARKRTDDRQSWGGGK
jgi:prepilin-type N-terminal cleavage/methylation domain-containing protein